MKIDKLPTNYRVCRKFFKMKEIPLTRGLVAIVDDADYPRLFKIKWCLSGKIGRFYAVTSSHPLRSQKDSYGLVYMHRIVMYALRNWEVDHVNGNTLDNRRCNLRLATRGQNVQNCKIPRTNTSGFKGVRKFRRRWQAYIKTRKKQYHLGLFGTPELAAAEYDKAARLLFGKFARLNGGNPAASQS